MTVMHAVKDDAHTLPGSNKSSNTDHEANSGKNSPAASSIAQHNQDCSNDATNNTSYAEAASEDDAWSVTVADRPTDEVRMGLMTQCPFDGVDDLAESSRMSGDSQGVEERSTFLGREVQLTWSPVGDVDCNDARDFFTEGLDGDSRVCQMVKVLHGLG